MARRLFTLVSSSSVPRFLPGTQIRMAASFTDHPAWIKKMKMRFDFLDADKNGIINQDDEALIAKNIATYRKEGEDAEKNYRKILRTANSFSLSGKREVDEETFVQEMKKFVSQPDAKERVKELADMIFSLIDGNNDGVISYNEFCQFYKAMNVDQEFFDTFRTN